MHTFSIIFHILSTVFHKFSTYFHQFLQTFRLEIHGNPCRSTRSTLQNWICYRMSVSRASGTPCGSVFVRFCFARSVKLEQLCGKISWKLWKTMAGKWKMDPKGGIWTSNGTRNVYHIALCPTQTGPSNWFHFVIPAETTRGIVFRSLARRRGKQEKNDFRICEIDFR